MNNSNTRAWWIGLASLAWFVGMLVLYFVSHKPLTPELAVALALVVWRLLLSFGLVCFGGGLGRLLLPSAPIPSPLARLALQGALGLGLLSLGYHWLGTLAGVYAWLNAILLVVGLALLNKSVRAWLGEWRALQTQWAEGGRWGRWAAGLCALLALGALLIALAPPVKFDSLTYHLTLPQAYSLQHRISYLPWLVMSGMPQIAETLYTWIYPLGGAPSAALLTWWAALLALIGLAGWLRDLLDARSALAGMAALMCGFSMVMLMGWGYVDWWGILFGWASMAALFAWRENGHQKDLWLAGLFIGLAMGSKYTAGVLALAGAAALGWLCWRQKRAFLPALAVLAAGALLTSGTWFLRNTLATGNPLYPFLFSAGEMNVYRLESYQSVPPWGNWLDIVFLPLRAMYRGIENAEGYNVSMGPLLAALGFLFWTGWRKLSERQRGWAEMLLAFSIAGILIWTAANQISGNLIQTRYYFSLFSAFGGLAALGYWGIVQLQIPQVRLGRIVSAMVLFVLLLNVIEVGQEVLKKDAPRAVLGLKSNETFLADNLGWFQPAMQAVKDLPDDQQVLLLFETRSFYCLPNCRPDEILDRWKRDWRELRDTNAILARWKAQGFEQVLFYRSGANFMRETGDIHITADDWQGLDAMLPKLVEMQDFGGAYQLYRLP